VLLLLSVVLLLALAVCAFLIFCSTPHQATSRSSIERWQTGLVWHVDRGNVSTVNLRYAPDKVHQQEPAAAWLQCQ
jgi:hypothetical protein